MRFSRGQRGPAAADSRSSTRSEVRSSESSEFPTDRARDADRYGGLRGRRKKRGATPNRGGLGRHSCG